MKHNTFASLSVLKARFLLNACFRRNIYSVATSNVTISTHGEMASPLKTAPSRAAEFSKRPEIRSQFQNEAAFLSFLVRDKYAIDRDDVSGPGIKWSENHMKILLMLQCFQEISKSSSEQSLKQEPWVRHLPLLTFIYEAIKAQLLDYDFAPSLETIGTKNVYMNISKTAKRDIDQLRKGGLVEMIMVTSTDSTECRAYRLAEKGTIYLRDEAARVGGLVDEIERFMHAPGYNKENISDYLLEVFWDSKKEVFHLVNGKGHSKRSTVTVMEDISYVCSPYVPEVLNVPNPLLNATDKTVSVPNNRDIAVETVKICQDTRGDNIRDELEEVVQIDGVHILTGEWVPFGPNILSYLNERFGAVEHTNGGIFSGIVDRAPEGTRLVRNQSKHTCYLNQVTHHNPMSHINFTSIVRPTDMSDKEIVQIDEFGVNVKTDGTVVYGLKIESAENRLEVHVSLDHISRLFVDTLRHSSIIVDNLLTNYQRQLMHCLHSENPGYRAKFNIVFGTELHPMMVADKYMDGADYENEIKQVIGETYMAFDLKDRELLFFGRDGLLVVGKRARRHEEQLLSYLSLVSRERALKTFFARSSFFGNVLKAIRGLLVKYEEDPGSLSKIRRLCQTAKQDLLLLNEILDYIRESFTGFVPPVPIQQDQGSTKLVELLQTSHLLQNLKARTDDLAKNMSAYKEELAALELVCQQHHEFEVEEWQKRRASSQDSAKGILELGQQAANLLKNSVTVLFGIFFYAIIDRGFEGDALGGKTALLSLASSSSQMLYSTYIGFWLLFLLIVYFITRARNVHSLEKRTLRLDFLINKFIDLDSLHAFLDVKKVTTETTTTNHFQRIRTVAWSESRLKLWRGKSPRFEITYDKQNCYLLHASVTIPNNHNVWSEAEIMERLLQDLNHCHVFVIDTEKEPWKDPTKPIYERASIHRKSISSSGTIVEIGRYMEAAEKSIRENNKELVKTTHEVVTPSSPAALGKKA